MVSPSRDTPVLVLVLAPALALVSESGCAYHPAEQVSAMSHLLVLAIALVFISALHFQRMGAQRTGGLRDWAYTIQACSAAQVQERLCVAVLVTVRGSGYSYYVVRHPAVEDSSDYIILVLVFVIVMGHAAVSSSHRGWKGHRKACRLENTP